MTVLFRYVSQTRGQWPYRTSVGLRFEIGDLNYLHIHVDIAYKVRYDGLWGHYSLQTALEVKCDLRFEICDLSYQYIYVHIVCMVPYGSLQGHYSLQTALEVKSDLRIENQWPQLHM